MLLQFISQFIVCACMYAKTQGKLWQSDLYCVAGRTERIRWKGRALFTHSVCPLMSGCTPKTHTHAPPAGCPAALHWVHPFPPNTLILKIESIYHHLTTLQKTCWATFQVFFWHSWFSCCSQIVQLFYFLKTLWHQSTLINQNKTKKSKPDQNIKHTITNMTKPAKITFQSDTDTQRKNGWYFPHFSISTDVLKR